MKSKFCKLIITLSFIITAFFTFSSNAFADPLTGAMIASQIASGFSFAGFASSQPLSISDLTGSFYTDLVPWADIVSAAHAYVTIRDLVTPANSVEVSISPEISTAGAERTEQFVSHYSIAPGGFVQFGDYLSYQGYIFNQPISIQVGSTPETAYKGGVVGYTPPTPQPFTGGLNNLANYRGYEDGNRLRIYYTLGDNTSGAKYLNTNTALYLSYTPTNGRWCWIVGTNSVVYDSWTTGGLPHLSSVVYSTSWAQDGQIQDPDGRENVVVLPATYVQNITYTSGEVIDTEEVVEAVLDAISVAGTDDAIISSTYAEQPVPPSEDTVSETLWTSFTTWFEDYYSGWTEVFGDIFDGISDFHESFGDWVEDVASGWTEVFGDIYDTVSGFTEVFGDIYDGITDGFADVAGTLEGIYDYVADIVQEIVNADANWVNGLLNNFLSQFQSWFDSLKSHVSIWHYVVEWLSSIGSCFSFFFGCLNSTGYSFVLPIYACFAGTVVIAVYRRFGK